MPKSAVESHEIHEYMPASQAQRQEKISDMQVKEIVSKENLLSSDTNMASLLAVGLVTLEVGSRRKG